MKCQDLCQTMAVKSTASYRESKILWKYEINKAQGSVYPVQLHRIHNKRQIGTCSWLQYFTQAL